MMIYENMDKLNAEHFGLLEKLYGMNKEELLKQSKAILEKMFFPEGDSPLWDAMLEFDDNYDPSPNTLLAEQICDILRPPEIYSQQDDYSDTDTSGNVA